MIFNILYRSCLIVNSRSKFPIFPYFFNDFQLLKIVNRDSAIGNAPGAGSIPIAN